jgi:hypothetical protein
VEYSGHGVGDFGDMLDFDGELGEGLDCFDLIELLEVAAANVVLVAGAGDQDHGPGVDHRVGEARKAVDAARARDGEQDAGTSREVAEGGGGVARSLLVVEGDEADAEGHGAVGEGRDGDAHHAKHVVHAEAGQGHGR